jgi:hypothetical protein
MRLHRLGMLVAACAAFCLAQTAAQADLKPVSYVSISANKFTFSYRVDGANLVAKLSYPTKGWLAVGFNPTDKMKDGNFIIGALKDKMPVVQDEFGTSPLEHKADTLVGGKNNIVASSVVQIGDTTTLSFTIPLDSGDPKDAKLEKGKEIKIIFAAGKEPDFSRKHIALGKAKITL